MFTLRLCDEDGEAKTSPLTARILFSVLASKPLCYLVRDLHRQEADLANRLLSYRAPVPTVSFLTSNLATAH